MIVLNITNSFLCMQNQNGICSIFLILHKLAHFGWIESLGEKIVPAKIYWQYFVTETK